jgi:Bacterial aa3 type cytochrome c oxidase subunit IV
MAEHGELEYAVAEGNDLPAHEASYGRFVHFVFIGIVHVINVLIGLTVGGVAGHWFLMFVIFVVATVAAAINLFTGNRGASIGALIFSLLCLLSLAF